jgi:transcription initiation factor TFIIB
MYGPLSSNQDEKPKSLAYTEKTLHSTTESWLEKLNYFVLSVKPRQYITRVCNQLEVHRRTEEVAHRILTGAKKLKLTVGRGPKGIAAAASYIASTITGERRTQRGVAEAADLTEVTIGNRYKEMMKRLLIVASLWY